MAVQARSTNKGEVYARRIKELVKNRNVTLKVLDDICGFTPGRMSQITSHRGPIGTPTDAELSVISRKLAASKEWLLGAANAVTPNGMAPDRTGIKSVAKYRDILGELMLHIDRNWVERLFQGKDVGFQRSLSKMVQIQRGGVPWPTIYRHEFSAPTESLTHGAQAIAFAMQLGMHEVIEDNFLKDAIETARKELDVMKGKNPLLDWMRKSGQVRFGSFIKYQTDAATRKRLDISQVLVRLEILSVCDPTHTTFDRFLADLREALKTRGREDVELMRLIQFPAYAFSCRFKQDQKKDFHGIYRDAVRLMEVLQQTEETTMSG